MALLVPDQAEVIMLKAVVNQTPPQGLILKLYTSNTTPAEADTEATYTEASGFGYASKALAGVSWTVTTTAGVSTASYAQQTWTFTGNLGNVYGYFVVQNISGKLMWAERFSDGPYNIVNNGDAIKVTPTISLD